MGSDTNYEDTREEDLHRTRHTLREWEEEEKHKKEGLMNTEQFINEQVGRKLLIYDDDLNRKKGNHHLEYFSWAVIICALLFIALQIIRCVGR